MSAPEQSSTAAAPPGFLSIHDGALFEVRFWPDFAWLDLSLSERPSEIEYVTGLGWVGAIRIRELDGEAPAAPRPDRRHRDQPLVGEERRCGTDRRRFDRMKPNV